MLSEIIIFKKSEAQRICKFALLALVMGSLFAADAVVVDPSGNTSINGAVTVVGTGQFQSPICIVPLATTGAPSTGTWAAGTLATDAASDLWQCTTAGTPGLWRLVINSGGAGLGGYIVLEDQKPAGTTGGAPVAGSWQPRVLNTEVTDTQSACTLSANRFTLVGGTYRIHAQAPFYRCDGCKIRLRDVINNATVLVGTTTNASASAYMNGISFLEGRFTVTTAGTYEIQYYAASASVGSLGAGAVPAAGEPEIYTRVVLTKE
jgi:hypothetical protein